MPPLSRFSATLAATALVGGMACQDATVPDLAAPPARLAAVAPVELLAAIADLDARVVPSLDRDAQAPMRSSLDALRTALLSGDIMRGHRAVAAARTLMAGREDADLSAISLVVDVVEQSLSVAP